MRFSQLLAVGAGLLDTAHGMNILITNNDGFGTANIRELYKQMKSLGHNCYIVASPTSQTDAGFRGGFTTHSTLAEDDDWGIVKAGARSLGPDPSDDHIWYYNGTPAAQVVVGLDYILPTFGKIASPDLVISESGPNAASTSDFFLQSISGTMSATYVAIERDIPAMVFWTGNNTSTTTARIASTLVQAFINKAAGGRVLPPGYGVTVKLPYITDECTNPPFILQRLFSGVTYNAKSDLFTQNTNMMNSTCVSSVTVFAFEMVGYDTTYHRECFNVTDVTTIIPVVVQSNGSVPVPGGLRPNASVSQPPTPDGPFSHPPTIISMGSVAVGQWSLGIMMFTIGIWACMW
ncbi:putative acid phosphatase [Podospora fimiseda]|uniref:Acid phosphatase n=1 Tax=Podospora fimiseda TaxID=252190 RepID=A0AAN7BM56_9PEZI|nr:putative acid phosphatase [Podospora fimiseda]